MNYKELKDARWTGKITLPIYKNKVIAAFYDNEGQFGSAIEYLSKLLMCECLLSECHVEERVQYKNRMIDRFYVITGKYGGRDFGESNKIYDIDEVVGLAKNEFLVICPSVSDLQIYAGDKEIDEFFDLFLINDEWDGQYFDDGVADNLLTWKYRKLQRYLGTEKERFIPKGILKEWTRTKTLKHQLGE